MCALPVLLYACLSLLFPFPVEEIEAVKQREMSTLILDKDGDLLRAFLGQDESRLVWTDLDQISPSLLSATIAVEDERFYHHPGVDPIAVGRAILTNLQRRRVVSGASTITMQVIRLLERRPRTLRSKMIESFRALQLERVLTKRQIIELYLNLAPYGGNLVGPEAASRSYFRKHAKDLTLGEAAILAGLVQSPSRYRPDRHPERMRLRRDHVLNRMYTCGYITRERLAVALKEPVRYIPQKPFPFEAPHLAEMVRETRGRETVLRTTIDRRIQTLAETVLRDGVNRLRAAGVSNGAVVVIENGTSAVRALVGSCDFFSVPDEGQVNGAMAPRSPGSALKPFIYALAFDRGLITPSSVLADVPAIYEGYQPVNYDHLFRGPVPAREALWASLNIPAVNLMGKVGQKKAYCLLKDVGIGTLRKDADHYGLSIALGSVDVSLLDLTNAYAALARRGEYRPYRLLETQPARPGRQVVSQEAAWLVADVLSDMSRMSGKVMSRSEKNRMRMAWKTGTSFGHRDAWTFAYTPEYTVGVWMGNFSGMPAKALVGVEAAAPVAAGIMERIYGDRAPTWYPVPKGVVTRKVCAVSGMPAKEICAAQKTDYCIQGVSADVPCTVHQLVKVDGETRQERVVESWPTALASWFRAHGQDRGAPPAVADQSHNPKIISPAPRQTYCLADAGASSQKVLLKAACAGDRLYWFVDDTLYRSCSSQDQTFWPLQPGRHKIVCADDSGRSAATVINVQ